MWSNNLLKALREIETLIQARKSLDSNNMAIISMNQVIASKVSHVCSRNTKRGYVADGALCLSKLAVIKNALACLNFDLQGLDSLMNAVIRQMCDENNILFQEPGNHDWSIAVSTFIIGQRVLPNKTPFNNLQLVSKTHDRTNCRLFSDNTDLSIHDKAFMFQTVNVRGVIWSRAARKLCITFARPRARPPVIICIELAQENDIYKLLNKIQSTSSSLWIESHPLQEMEHVFAKQAQKEYAEDWMEAMDVDGKKESCSLESEASVEMSLEVEKAVVLTKVSKPEKSLEHEESFHPGKSFRPEKTALGCVSALKGLRLMGKHS